MQESRKPKYRSYLLVLCCILLVASTSGCTDQKAEITEITLMHGWGSTEPDHVSMREIYQDFEKENPDIRIHLLSLPTTDELIRKVEDSIMVGEIPDIVFLAGKGRDSVYRYMVNHGYALDLMPYIEADAEFRSNLAPANLDYWTTKENHLFTISDVLIVGGGYWYNQDIFEKAGVTQLPTTWNDFENTCSLINAWAASKGNGVKALQLSTEGYLYFASHILAQKGLENTKGKVSIEPEKMMDTLSILDRIHTYSVSDGGSYNYRDETSLFNAGNLAICVNGVWGASMISDEINAAYSLLPSEGTSISCESSGLGYVLGHTGDTARENASVRFLKYLMEPKVQERILTETQQFPANPKIAIEDYAEQMPRFCQAIAVTQQAEQKIEIPKQLWSTQQFAVFEENIISVLSENMQKQTLINLLKQ